jgi:flagellar hook-associated protein 1 FlgK
MVSTFGLLNTAYTGLVAARAGMDVTGQNIANAGTAGYVRQRLDQTALGTGTPALFATGPTVGGGVAIAGVSRLNDSLLDARARDTASTSGYWDTAAAAMSGVESTLNEPGTDGLSATLNDFWADWQGMANSSGSPAQASVLIGEGKLVASRIAGGYTAATTAWSGARAATASAITTVNDTAKQIASLNEAILRTTATGGNPNELIGQRSVALTALSQLTGAVPRDNADGTVDVVVGGNALVSGINSRSLRLVGTSDITLAGTDPVRVEWSNTPGFSATIDGGEIAARLATLAGPASGGSGGIYAEAVKVYNDLAGTIASQVNAIHRTGTTSTGASGLDFFAITPGGPAALNLSVVPTSVGGVAAANGSLGKADGSVADAIAQLGRATGSPNTTWSIFVSNVGAQSRNAATQSGLAGTAAAAAITAQTSQSGVDLDEETSNLVTYQHAYQAAARVLSTVDQMLDTLINHTGS